MDKRKFRLSYKKPVFAKNLEAIKEIEMATESIPQLLLQIYIFQKENNIFNLFSPLVVVYKWAQILSIVTSTLSIIFGLKRPELCKFDIIY